MPDPRIESPTELPGIEPILNATFEDVPDAVIFADMNRRILLANPAAERIFGYGNDELIGQETSILYPDDEQFAEQGRIRFNQQNTGESQHFECLFRKKSGKIFFAETIAAVVRGAAGESTGFLGIIRDMTERKTLEAEATLAKWRLDEAIEALHEGILFDADERLVAFNRRFTEMYPVVARNLAVGRTYEEMLREGVRNGQFDIAPEDRAAWIEGRIADFRTPPSEPVETQLTGNRWTLVSKRRTEAGDTITSYVDITRRKRLEDALTKLNAITSTRSLDHEQKIKQALTLGVAHFGLPIGIVSRIEDDCYEVLYATSPDDALLPGTRFPLGKTYCVHTLAADAPIGFHRAGESSIADHPCYREFALESYIGAPLFIDDLRFGTLNFSSPEPRSRPFESGELRFVALLADWVGNELARLRGAQERDRLEAGLRRLATTDELTGIDNRRSFLETGRHALAQARRYNRPVSLIMADLDHFKAINDRYGHDGGDEALRAFVARTVSVLRETDTFGRLGGEEFAILLPETGLAGALKLAGRLGERVRATPIPFENAAIALTASFGVVELSVADESLDDMIKRADVALYRAKAEGRDRAVTG